ncbi:MAG: carboxypeptidase regulatory-like domain-containing protein [Archaeoglobus sp.]|nr:carboxypeptidase regulatory-like domain-containing protein [Archaeoglobus sp.]
MEKNQLILAGFGILLIALGGLYYFGYFDNFDWQDYIPWFADRGDIKATVFDGNGTSDTSDDIPLENATVYILGTELQKITGSDGVALFENVDVGDYTVVAEHNSTLVYEDVTVQKDATVNVTLIFNAGS